MSERRAWPVLWKSTVLALALWAVNPLPFPVSVCILAILFLWLDPFA